jgi:hypothetical protein
MVIRPLPAPAPAPQAPQLYLLRVWPGEPGFRAVLREVGGTEPGGVFNRPEQLAEFLRRLRPAVTRPD